MNAFKNKVCYCNLTYICNNSCKHCVSNSVRQHSKKKVSLEDYMFFNNLFHMCSNDVWTISGGEPTLSNELLEIIDFCYSVSSHIIMYTNGRLLHTLPKKTLDKIERIIVPLYGAEDVHNYYVNSKTAYQETINSLKGIIEYNPNLIDIKILFQEEENTESIFLSPEWKFLKQNIHFSITRVLNPITKENCTKELAHRISRTIYSLINEDKMIRFYDIPVCLMDEDLQNMIEKFPITDHYFDTNVICGSANGHYEIFPFNKPTKIMSHCRSCSKSKICCMIMRNYFCPLITNSKIFITTE